MISRACQICGKEFEVYPSYIKRGRAKFCSHKCGHIWYSKTFSGKNHPQWKGGKKSIPRTVSRNCKTCGKEFGATYAQIRKGFGRYCSHKCHGVHHSKYRSGANCYRWKGGPVTVICKICKKKFKVSKSRIKYRLGKFCSRSCSSIWTITHCKLKDTSIEKSIEKELLNRKIKYRKQVPIWKAKTIVDFLLPKKIVVYCDGDYWHNLPGCKDKDSKQNFLLRSMGYRVYRFTETEIERSAHRCIDKVARIK